MIQGGIMSIKCGKCGERHESAAKVKECYNTGGTPDRQVIVTCGWGKSAHKWTTTVREAVEHRNTCPEHRQAKPVVKKAVKGPWLDDAMWTPDIEAHES